ncbi:hypothetical protein [Psychrobacter sp. AOP31-A1-22]|uniref:hypothetical protein n=1 Tax=Psychrobacter sp. AOP31-A1-22 TaxID=3457696 RepID=UPI0040369ED9
MRLLLSILFVSMLTACSSSDENTSSTNTEITSKEQVSQVNSGDAYSDYIGYWHSNTAPNGGHTIVSEVYKDGDSYIVNPDINFDLASNTTRKNTPVVLTPNNNKLLAEDDKGNTMELSLSDDGQTLNGQSGGSTKSFTRLDKAKADEITATIKTCVDLYDQFNARSNELPVGSHEFKPQSEALNSDFADKFAPYRDLCHVPNGVESELRMRDIGG